MALEIRILKGARAGQVEHFDKPVIHVGRSETSDLRFDAHKDIDVSGHHAELRLSDGRYLVQDRGSTNGTFVNGQRVPADGARELKDGDRVLFGGNGPEIEVHFQDRRGNTEERIAVAVKKQTAGLQKILVAAVAVLVVGLGGAYYIGQRASRRQLEEFRQMLAMNDSVAAILQGGMSGSDTAFVNELQRKSEALRAALATASTDAMRDSLHRAIEANEARMRRMVQMDLPAINTRNSPAVAILVSEIDGTSFAGTGFSISPDGLLLTNRHNVRNEDGRQASRIAVKFVNTGEWKPAHVVKVSDVAGEDLALIQMDEPGPYPVIEGISSGNDVSEGISVVTIGFPLGYETPQEGEGNAFVAKSTLNPGTISKRTSSVLQIDSYASHGSSGSPVFSARGLVVGVVYGGQPEAGGRIVFAVPPNHVAAFVPDANRAIVKN
jgi:S1-C subfamily serine protease